MCPRMATRTSVGPGGVLGENDDIAGRIRVADLRRAVERLAPRHHQVLARELALHLPEVAYLNVERRLLRLQAKRFLVRRRRDGVARDARDGLVHHLEALGSEND